MDPQTVKMAPPRRPESLAGRAKRLFAEALPRSIVVRRGPGGAKAVALTFDDGPHELTDAYLDVLDRYDARATFFVIGKACVAHPAAVRRMVARGHEVAGHGFEHIAFPKLGASDLEDELARTAALLPPPRTRRALVRPPTGATTPRSLARCARAGYTTVLWSRDSDDCRTQDPAEIAARLAPDGLEPGEIVLLHECQPWTLAALPLVLEGLQRGGFRAVPVGELADLSMPATVLYLVDGLGLSGKTKAMVDLVTGLDRDRYRGHVVCFDTEGSPLVDRLTAADTPVDVVPCPDGLNLGVVARIAALARRLRPEVIHCYNPRTMLYGGTVARTLMIRATLGSLSAFACLTPDGDYSFLPQKLFSTSPRNRWRNRLACGLVRRIVTVSPTLGRNFCRYNRVDERRLRVVSYGVDTDKFARVSGGDVAAFRTRHGVPIGGVLVTSVGRLVEQKDYPTQLRAFALAAARQPTLTMMLVGDGPLRAELEALARELGIAERVRFIGHSNDIPVALRAADIFVLASKFEPYGVAILEAKAAGAPIVATRVNEIPEILSADAGDGKNTGLVVPPEDPEAMAAAFTRLANDAIGRQAMGRRAAEDAVRRHSLTNAISTYQDLYDEARGAPRRESRPPGAF